MLLNSLVSVKDVIAKMKIKRTKIFTLFILIAVIISFGILTINRAPSSQSAQLNKIQITTSFYPLYYFASEIGGDKTRVVNITPAGSEPHDYEPTPQDIIQIANSRALFLNGGLEPWGQRIKENIKDKNITVVDVGQNLMSQDFLDEDGKKVTDPHIWLSPVLAQKMIDKIVDVLVSIDPSNKDYYLNNSVVLKDKLNRLHDEYLSGLKNCQSDVFVTSHAAFGYLASTYGLKQVTISGLSPEEEPSLKQLAEVTDFAKKNAVKYIFFETLVSPKLSDTLANEIGAKTLVLNPLEGLHEADIKDGKSYLTEMKNNLQNLKIALTCQ
jgi:zinc transport system substrate-binding protein